MSPRFAPDNSLVEITARTVASQFLLRPCPELNEIILATIARAMFLFPVRLHAFAFLSNHWHALVTPLDGCALSRFVQHVHSNIAKAVNAMLAREGQVFRPASWVAVARDAEVERLKYVLSQGAKEGLVASPLEWPGVHAARALAGLETLRGRWIDRTRACRLKHGGGRRGGRAVPLSQLTTTYEIELAPLPSMSHLTAEQHRGEVCATIEAIELSAKLKTGSPLGAAKVLAQSPTARPHEIKRWPVPFIHTNDQDTRSSFLCARRSFLAEYRAARAQLRSGRSMRLPPHCFPPIVPFQARTSSVSVIRLVSAPTVPASNAPKTHVELASATQVKAEDWHVGCSS